VFGLGTYEPLEPSNGKVFAHVRRYEDDVVLCVHNLARSAQAVELDLGAYEGRVPEEMFGRTRFPPIGELPYLLTLAPRGFFWFLLVRGRRGDLMTSPNRARASARDVIKEWSVSQRLVLPRSPGRTWASST
jgi:hypothetical protein